MKARNGKSKTHEQELAKDHRREEGLERNNEWRSLTPAQQLTKLNAKLGNGVGARKQRAQLMTKIAAA